MLGALEAIAAMKSGPAQLAAYHELALRAEARGMTPEELEIMERSKPRLEKIFHPETKQGADEMAETTEQTAPADKPKRKRGPNKAKVATPGEVTIKVVCSVADATELLGFMVRNQHPEIAHQIVDALAKAQKNGD